MSPLFSWAISHLRSDSLPPPVPPRQSPLLKRGGASCTWRPTTAAAAVEQRRAFVEAPGGDGVFLEANGGGFPGFPWERVVHSGSYCQL